MVARVPGRDRGVALAGAVMVCAAVPELGPAQPRAVASGAGRYGLDTAPPSPTGVMLRRPGVLRRRIDRSVSVGGSFARAFNREAALRARWRVLTEALR